MRTVEAVKMQREENSLGVIVGMSLIALLVVWLH